MRQIGRQYQTVAGWRGLFDLFGADGFLVAGGGKAEKGDDIGEFGGGEPGGLGRMFPLGVGLEAVEFGFGDGFEDGRVGGEVEEFDAGGVFAGFHGREGGAGFEAGDDDVLGGGGEDRHFNGAGIQHGHAPEVGGNWGALFFHEVAVATARALILGFEKDFATAGDLGRFLSENG